MFFFFHFLSIDILAKFDPKIAKLVEFIRKKKFKFFLNYFGKNGEISPRKKKALDGRIKNQAGGHS
jgi:hypothetical protein